MNFAEDCAAQNVARMYKTRTDCALVCKVRKVNYMHCNVCFVFVNLLELPWLKILKACQIIIMQSFLQTFVVT